MSRAVTRRALATAALLALALLLVGCANIPSGGDVSRLALAGGGGNAAPLSLPDEPVKGATQEQILDGFLKAGRGPQASYQVAHDFLSAGFSSRWNPNSGVLISSSPIDPLATAADAVEVTIGVSAEVDGIGRYTSYATPQAKSLAFTFTKEKGEWRISSAPDGTVLSPSSFGSNFSAYSLYFFDPSFQYLVPDQRWFADTRSISTLIVRGLLAGPSDWLGNGVLLSAFPGGTQLTGTPTIESGRATVDLSSKVASESTATQRRMIQQLTQSLVVLGNLNSASISVGGFPITVPDGPAPLATETVLEDPIGFEKGVFGTLVGGAVRLLPGVGGAVDKLAPIGAAVARNGTDVATLSAGGVSVVRGTSPATTLDRRPGLTVPSSDPEGFVWSVPAGQPGAIIAFDTQGKPHPVAFSYDGTVVSMDVSRDGTRVLIALATASGPKLLIAGIIRDKDLVPTGLGPAVYPAIGTSALVDASWIDNNSVVVLSQDAGSTAVDSYVIGGRGASLGSVPNGVAVVGGNGADGIRVLDSAGTVFRPSGSFGWQATGLHASFLASQQ